MGSMCQTNHLKFLAASCDNLFVHIHIFTQSAVSGGTEMRSTTFDFKHSFSPIIVLILKFHIDFLPGFFSFLNLVKKSFHGTSGKKPGSGDKDNIGIVDSSFEIISNRSAFTKSSGRHDTQRSASSKKLLS